MLLYLITYDIPCHRRRQKVAKLLEGYGQRVQFSVFECRLPPQKYRELQRRLKRHWHEREDSIRFYPLHGQLLDQVEVWGGPAVREFPGAVVI